MRYVDVRGSQLCHCPPSFSGFSSDHKGWDLSHRFTACIANDACARDHWTISRTTTQTAHKHTHTAWHSTSKLTWLLYSFAYVLKASNTWFLNVSDVSSLSFRPWSLELIGSHWNSLELHVSSNNSSMQICADSGHVPRIPGEIETRAVRSRTLPIMQLSKESCHELPKCWMDLWRYF